MKIKPLHDWIYAQKIKTESVSKGGIIAVQKSFPLAVAIAVGPGRYDNGIKLDMSVNVGDKFLVGQYSQETFTVDGEEVFMIRDCDVPGVVEKEEA